MRRIKLPLLLAILLCQCFIPCLASADNTCGSFDYRVQDGGAVITRYHHELEDYTVYIPEELDGYPVIGIARRAFIENIYYDEIYVPDCVQFIEEDALTNEYGAPSIVHLSSKTKMHPKAVPIYREIELVIDGQRTWGGSAAVTAAPATPTPVPSDFQYAVLEDGVSVRITGYTGTDRNVTIPAMIGAYQVTEIGDAAFAQQLDMKSVVIPEGVTRICFRAFFNCVRLRSITIPDSVVEISSDAFVNCASLSEVVMPAALDMPSVRKKAGLPLKSPDWPYSLNPDGSTITITAYKGADKKVTVPATVDGRQVTAISGAFKGLGVTEVVIPEGVVTLGDEAFFGCPELTSVTLPSTLTTIGSYAFRYTPKLTGITLPGKLQTIGGFAFGDSGLVSVTLPDSISQIGFYAFENCKKLAEVDLGCGISGISESMFMNCTALSSITIPASISQIGVSAFSGSGLKSVAWAERNAAPYTIEAFAFHECTQLTDFAPAEGLFAIRDDALLNCTALKSLTLPGTTVTIGIRTFAGCTGLSSLKLNEGLQQIGRSAFLACYSLSHLDVPGTVVKIGEDAFASCGITDAADAVLPQAINTTDVRRYAGLPVDTFELAQIGVNQWELVCYNGADTALVIPESYHGKQIVRIGEKAFWMDEQLTSITLPDTITSIGRYAFEDCDRLSRVVLGKNLRSIAYKAFCDCDALTEVVFARDGVSVSIGQQAFTGCPRLISVALPSGMEDDNLARAESGLPLVADERLHGDWQAVYASAGGGFGTIIVHFHGDGTGEIECRLSDENALYINLVTDYHEETGEIRALAANASGEQESAFAINLSLYDMDTASKTLHGRIEDGLLMLSDSNADYVLCALKEDIAALGSAHPVSKRLIGDWQSVPSGESEPVMYLSFRRDGTCVMARVSPDDRADAPTAATVWEWQGKLYLTLGTTGETESMSYQLSQDGQNLSLTQKDDTINLFRTIFEPGLDAR